MNNIHETTRHNCLISDARFGRNDTLCVYLLKMREYFRWEKQIPFDHAIDREELGNWVQEREQLWDELEDQAFSPIYLNQETFSEMEACTISEKLSHEKLLYGAGIGRQGQPHFFLAELEESYVDNGLHYFITGKELVRGLTVLPAMLQENRIYIRKSAIRQLLWERIDEWRFNGHQRDTAIGRSIQALGLDQHAATDTLLDQMAQKEVKAIILHEQGEAEINQAYPQWPEMIQRWIGTPAERYLRALKDLQADLETTWPYLLQELPDAYGIHAWFANFKGVRTLIAGDLKNLYEQDQALATFRNLRTGLSRLQSELSKLYPSLFELEFESPQAIIKLLTGKGAAL